MNLQKKCKILIFESSWSLSYYKVLFPLLYFEWQSIVWETYINLTLINTSLKQQGPTVYHKNYIQYPMINHNGKGYEKEYKYIWLNHFAVQRKLMQHCKSTKLQHIFFLNTSLDAYRYNQLEFDWIHLEWTF